jgi:hypothetical protein
MENSNLSKVMYLLLFIQWMLAHGGIPTEDSYGPYMGQDGYCHLDRAKMALKIKGWVNVTSGIKWIYLTILVNH